MRAPGNIADIARVIDTAHGALAELRDRVEDLGMQAEAATTPAEQSALIRRIETVGAGIHTVCEFIERGYQSPTTTTPECEATKDGARCALRSGHAGWHRAGFGVWS